MLHPIQRIPGNGKSGCRFVLDVRNNGGGFFPAGVDVAKMLLSGGDIVLIADSQGVRDSYEADGTAVDSKSQLAVLVNRGTASASEVRPRHIHPSLLPPRPLCHKMS